MLNPQSLSSARKGLERGDRRVDCRRRHHKPLMPSVAAAAASASTTLAILPTQIVEVCLLFCWRRENRFRPLP